MGPTPLPTPSSKHKPQYPSIQFHGFGDIDYSADSRRGMDTPYGVGGAIPYGVNTYGEKNTFFLGEFDLFLTSQLADNMSIVNETTLSAGLNNEMGLDIERLYFEYRDNDYFNIDVGMAVDGWQREWLNWAREHADRIDPMANGFLESERQKLEEQTAMIPPL